MDDEEKERIYQEKLNTLMNYGIGTKVAEILIKELEKLNNMLGNEAFEDEYPQLSVFKNWLQLSIRDPKTAAIRMNTFERDLERLEKIHEKARKNS